VLTSLRFFAAALIVVHHSRGSFGLPEQLGEPFVFDQGVAFFFVLSGFILAYVYPSLETFGRRRFILARIARVWPAHVATLILFLLLQPAAARNVWDGHSLRILVANLFMVHAWIPQGEYYFSFNSPSWSISTEFAFYLCFIGLIPNWRGTWAAKLAVVFFGLVGLILFGNAWNVPAWTPANTTGLTLDGLVYVNPFARLLEFTLGMSTALAWAHLRPRLRFGLLVGTLLEMSLFGLVAYAMYQSSHGASLAGGFGSIGSAGGVWLAHAGISCLPFAGLILVMALELGLLSRLLAFPLLVLLGEISYSLYLIHQIVLRYYAQHAPALAVIPGWIAYSVFWALTLLAAYVTWAVVERPARRFLVGLWPGRPIAHGEIGLAGSNRASPAQAGHDSLLDPGWRASLAGVVLLLILVPPIAYLMNHRVVMSAIGAADADALASRGPKVARGVRFGDRFVLLGADIQRTGAGLTLELAWQSLQTQPLKYSVPVHLINDAGSILGQADYAQGGGAQDEVQAGTIWRDLITIPPAKLAGASAVGIGLLDPVSSNWLLADRGPRDWADRRLLLPLSNTAANASSITTPSDQMLALRAAAGAGLDYEGFHDTSDCAGISGWAWDRSRPNSPIAVDLYDGDRLLAKLPADRFRQDLLEGGKGNGSHGLTYAWPPSVRDGRPHTIRLKVSGTDVELQNTARSITCSAETLKGLPGSTR